MSRKTHGGKGDTPRPVDQAAYASGWDRIFGKKEPEPVNLRKHIPEGTPGKAWKERLLAFMGSDKIRVFHGIHKSDPVLDMEVFIDPDLEEYYKPVCFCKDQEGKPYFLTGMYLYDGGMLGGPIMHSFQWFNDQEAMEFSEHAWKCSERLEKNGMTIKEFVIKHYREEEIAELEQSTPQVSAPSTKQRL